MKYLLVGLLLLCSFSVATAETVKSGTPCLDSQSVPVHSVALTWTEAAMPTDVTLTGFNVLRSTTSGSGYTQIAVIPATTFAYTDTAVTAGATYYYVMTAVGTNTAVAPVTVTSVYSAQVTALIPNVVVAVPPAPTSVGVKVQ